MTKNPKPNITTIMAMLSVLLVFTTCSFANVSQNPSIIEKIYNYKVMEISFSMTPEQVESRLNSLAYKRKKKSKNKRIVKQTYSKKVLNEFTNKHVVSTIIFEIQNSQPEVISTLDLFTPLPINFNIEQKIAQLYEHFGEPLTCSKPRKNSNTNCTIRYNLDTSSDISLKLTFGRKNQRTIFKLISNSNKSKSGGAGIPATPTEQTDSKITSSDPQTETTAGETANESSPDSNTQSPPSIKDNEQDLDKEMSQNSDPMNTEEKNNDSSSSDATSKTDQDEAPTQEAGSNQQTKEQDLREAAEQGDAQAQYEMGLRHEETAAISGSQAHAKEAVDWYTKAAEQGHMDAQYRLAIMLLDEKGTLLDMQQGIDWLEKAAENGNADAAYRLAMHHLQGIGVNQNDKLALKWFEKAKALGHSKSTYRLAQMYELGLGVDIDKTRAEQLFQLAANQKGQNEKAKIGEFNGTNIFSLNQGVKVDTSYVPF